LIKKYNTALFELDLTKSGHIPNNSYGKLEYVLIILLLRHLNIDFGIMNQSMEVYYSLVERHFNSLSHLQLGQMTTIINLFE
jgi:hypothetical protein